VIDTSMRAVGRARKPYGLGDDVDMRHKHDGVTTRP